MPSIPIQRKSTEELGLSEILGIVILGGLLAWPRLVILAFAVVSSHLLRDAFDGWVVPAVGFLLVPWTTLAYASMWSISSDRVSGAEWAVVGVALLIDAWTWSAFRR